MTRILIAYGSVLVPLLVIDLVWLGVVGHGLYQRAIGPLLLERPNLVPAALFYLLYAAGVVVFAVSPALGSGGWRSALIFGALFGFFCYLTYDLTNLSVLRGFSAQLAVIDIAWGAAVTGVCATIGLVVTRWLSG